MATKSTRNFLICVLVTACLFIIIPINESFTIQMKAYILITVFCIANLALESMPTLAIAVLLPAMYFGFGVAPLATAFSAFSGAMFWQALGALFLGAVMSKTGLLSRISCKIVSMMGGSFTGAVWGAFLACSIINVITFGSGFLVAIPVIVGICKAFDLKCGKESSLICFAGMLGAVEIGNVLYIPSVAAIYNTLIDAALPDYPGRVGMLTFFQYDWFGVILCVLAVLIAIKMYKRSVKKAGVSAIKSESTTREAFELKLKELGPMSVDEWKSLAMFIILLAGCIGGSLWGWNQMAFFMIVPYLSLFPVIGCGDKARTALSEMKFDGVFFMASCLAIGTVGASIGFSEWISGLMLPTIQGKGSLFTIVLFMVVIIVMNFALTPNAIISGLGAPFMTIGSAVGIGPLCVSCLIGYSAAIIFMPHEVAAYLIIYGTGYWSMQEFVKLRSMEACIYIVGLIAVMFPYWSMTGLLAM